MLDANDTLQKPNSKFSRWVRNHTLLDVHVRQHGTDGEPPTFARGSRRIDYILATAEIAGYIKAAGILPLNDFCTSDHRALFVDIALQEYLRGSPNPLAPQSCRGLQSSDPRAVRKYRRLLQEYLDRTPIELDVEDARKKLRDEGYSEAIGKILDKLDQEFTSARLEMEAQCAKTTSHPWSPTLRNAKNQVSYWKIWLSELRLKRDFSAQRAKVRQEPLATKPTMSDVTKALRSAKRELRKTIAKAKELRQNHLKERSEMARAEGKITDEQAIKRILRAEEQKEVFARLRCIMKKENRGALTHVLVDVDGRIQSVHDQNAINDLLTQRNAQHFSQAEGTPFTVPPMTTLFGRYGTNTNSQQLLNGKLQIDNIETTEATKTLLVSLKRLAPEGSVSSYISAEDIRNGYKGWRESTSTSPSGLHLGHEKAIMRYEDQGKDKDPDKKRLSDRVFSIKATLLNIAVESGHVYSRWTKIVNAMIEKIPGRPLVNKLRVIHLIESDFNLLTGILWGRRLMAKGERCGAFGDDQGGSRKDRRAQEILLFKHLVYSVVRLTKTNCASFDNDAKSCYDRIVMLLASLSSQSLGLDPKACELFLRVLEKAKYHVKTQLGVSTDFYQTNANRKIHGPGQGGKSSPSIWTIISCLLMKCMRAKSDGARFFDPYREIVIHKISSGFVDDITHLVNSFLQSLQGDDSLQELARQTTTTAQWWEELLHATGGKLELQKCFFYMMYWEFDREGVARLTKTEEAACEVKIRDSESGSDVHIEQKDCNEAHKTLGAMETPSGNYVPEVNRLVEKAQAIAQRISTATINRHEAHTIYRSMYLPSVNYSFPAGILSLKEAERVQGAPIQALLSAMGYNSHMPREVVFGPQESGGLGLRHLFAEQGSIKAITLIQQVRTDRSLGKMIQIQLRWAQKVSGISTPILEDTTTSLPHLRDEKWLTTLREFLAESELGIRMAEARCPMMKRESDIVLMDVVNHCGFSDEEIRRINRCRVFLRAECLSDISNAEGTRIHDDAYECTTDARIQTTEDWPRQPRPGKLHRRMWKVFLQCFCINELLWLRSHLGGWIRALAKRKWNSYYDPSWRVAATLEEDGTWAARKVTQQTRRGWKLSEPVEPIEIDKDVFIPTDTETKRNGDVFISAPPSPWWKPQTTTREPLTWSEHIESLQAWEKSLLETNWESASSRGLCAELIDESARLFIVSDGGQIGELGSYGWTIGTQEEILWEGTGPARGQPMTSQRAEAYGKLAWTCFIIQYSQFMGIEIKCSITSYCDNIGVVQQTAFDISRSARDSIKADYDVLWETTEKQRLLRKCAPRLHQGKHIKGHQDRTKQRHELSRPAQLNVRADEIATQTLRQMLNRNETPDMIALPNCSAYLLNDGKIQPSQEIKTLRWKWSDFNIQEYYCTRLNISATSLHRINWEAYRIARRRLTAAEQTFATKMLVRWLPTGHQVKKYGNKVTACHRCGEDETVDHLFLCKANKDWKTNFLQKLDKFLHDIDTAADIKRALISGFTKWLDPDLLTTHHRYPVTMRKCHKLQDEIGWNLAMCGLLDENWGAHQEAYLALKPDRRLDQKGTVWATKTASWLILEARQKWLERNNEAHNHNDGQSKTERETLEQVRNLYNMGADMSQHDRTMFDEPLEERLQRPILVLQQWVKHIIPTVNRCIRDFRQKLHDKQSDIRKFFQQTTQRTVQPSAPTNLPTTLQQPV